MAEVRPVVMSAVGFISTLSFGGPERTHSQSLPAQVS